jgi:hypothetical protein
LQIIERKRLKVKIEIEYMANTFSMAWIKNTRESRSSRETCDVRNTKDPRRVSVYCKHYIRVQLTTEKETIVYKEGKISFYNKYMYIRKLVENKVDFR